MSAASKHAPNQTPLLSRPQMWLVLGVAAQMLMEISLVSLWYQALFPSVALSWVVILCLLLLIFAGSYTLASLSTFPLQPSHPRREAVLRPALFLAWLIIAMIGSLRLMVFSGTGITLFEMLRHPVFFFTHAGIEGAGFTHLIIAVLLVWRGIHLARRPATRAGFQLSFQAGLILLMIYGLSYAQAHPSEAVTGLYFYLFWALIGMSAVRIASLSDERSGRIPRFAPGWLLGIGFTALGFVGLCILIGWFASQRIVAWIIAGVALFFAMLTALAYTVLEPLLIFLFHLIGDFLEILRRLFERISRLGLPAALQDLAEQINEAVSGAIPPNLGSHMTVVIAVFLLIGITLFLGLRFRAYRRGLEEEENGLVEAGKGSLRLENWIRRLLPERLKLRHPGQVLAAARIRFIYRSMISLSRKRGVDRHPALTPLEFIPRLASVFPKEPEAVETITAAYVRVRYGEYPETLQEVAAVQRAWDAIRIQKAC